MLDRPLPAQAPRWRPGAAHVLAYAHADGTVRAVNTDTGAVVLRKEPGQLAENEEAAVRRVLGATADADTPVRSPDGRWLAAGWPDTTSSSSSARSAAGRSAPSPTSSSSIPSRAVSHDQWLVLRTLIVHQ